jgi:hypothetical protein
LAALTERFVRRGVMPSRPNGSALAALRTNEIALDSPWQLREFVLNASGALVPDTVKLTPDGSFNGTTRLADYINANEAAILSETHEVPLQFQDQAFATGAVFNELQGWRAIGVKNPEARHKFSLNTCNGCHSSEEAGVFFLQVGNRFPGQEAFLSGFLTGTTVTDPVTFQPRTHNDLARRNRDLHALVCPAEEPPPSVPAPPDAGAPAPKTPTVTSGIRRVH